MSERKKPGPAKGTIYGPRVAQKKRATTTSKASPGQNRPYEEPVDVSLANSPVRRRPLLERMEVPPTQAIDTSMGGSSLPFGSDEGRQTTQGFQPRTRLNTSREMEFRSRGERNAHFKKMMDNNALGKTYIPDSIKNNGFFSQWMRTSIKGNPDGSNLRNAEARGWEWYGADEVPELAFWDYNGDLNDTSSRVEGGGLILGKLDNELYQYALDKQARARNDQVRMQSRLSQVDATNVFYSNQDQNQEAFYANPGTRQHGY